MQNHDPRSPGRWFVLENGDDLPGPVRDQGGFLPDPLRSDLSLHSLTHRRLAAAERELGRLDEAADWLPDRSPLVRGTQMREIQSSFGLDGFSVALQEVLLLDGPGEERVVHSSNDVINRYMTVADEAFEAMRAGALIDVPRLGQISAELAGARTVDPQGLWREDRAWLGGRDPADAWLVAAPPGPDLVAVAEQVGVWLAAECDLPIVGKIALGHWLLALLQPFGEGRNHLARMYVGLELVRSGVLRDQILPISMWIDGNDAVYRTGVLEAVHHGGFDRYVSMFATGVQQQCRDQIRVIKRMEKLREYQLEQLSANGRGVSRTSKVASDLIASPVFNHRQIQSRYGISRQTAGEITKRLQKAGLIENARNKKYKKVFVATAVVDLLSLNDPLPPDHDDDAFPTAG